MSIKKKIINKTSSFIADNFMGGKKAKKNIKQTDQYVKDKKFVREAKGAEPLVNDYTSPLFRARANVSNYETEYARRMSKGR